MCRGGVGVFVRVCKFVCVGACVCVFACYRSANLGACERVDAGVFTSSIYQLKRRRIDERSTPLEQNTADSWHRSDGLAVLDMKTSAASSPSRNLQFHQYACANSVLIHMRALTY